MLGSSSGDTLFGNNLSNNGHGIEVGSSSGDALFGNNITNNLMGVVLTYSFNNVLYCNNVANNTVYDFWLYNIFNNSVFHNNIVTNGGSVYSEVSNNTWDDGFPSGGNYWSDYLTKYPNATETDDSGIWNTPYVIGTNNTDYYPLMVPHVIPEFPSFLIPTLFIMATLLPVIAYRKRQGEKS